MNYRMTCYLLGALLTIESALLLLPTAVSVYYGEDVLPFLYTILIVLAVSIPLILLKPKNTRIAAKEGFVVSSLSWIFMSLFGALPFVFSGAIPHYIDALFETVSGFTTTGASILTAVEGLPKGILFWRSFTHWVGGMGVLMLMLAILPSNSRAIHLMRAEVPGPTKDKLVPQMKQTAKILYLIYIVLSAVQVVVLLCTGMPLYDSVVSTFATAGTGGFAVLNSSIAGYANPAAEWVIAIFMMLFGINFNLFHLILLKKAKDAFKSEELRIYLLICAVSVGLIMANIWHMYDGFMDVLRVSFFNVTSIMSTTGFAVTDYNQWPMFSKVILMFLMFTGACAGSTAGGFKISRLILVIKNAKRELKHLLHPRSVNVVRMDKAPVPEETVKAAGNYAVMYLVLFIVSVLLVAIDGFAFEDTFSGVLTCFNNVGPGIGMVGPSGNFSEFSVFSKIVLSVDMLLGRLEILPILVTFSPSTWTKR